MSFYINYNIKSFDDYLAALRSKYRIRMNKAMSELGDLELRELQAEDIRRRSKRLQELYLSVATRVNFNLFYLNATYWEGMKETLGERFSLYVYEEGGRIRAFFTVIDCDDELNAHFLGYEDSLIASHDIYLNMLLEHIRIGIHRNKKRIVMSRTAMEIKSSVGAVPEPMYMLYEHRSRPGRFAFPFILNVLNPTRHWRQRHPFRN